MTDVLGYRRFGAQGGDWGAFVASRDGARYPERVDGHPPQPARRPPRSGDARDPTPEEKDVSSSSSRIFLKEEIGYQWIQGTGRRRWPSALPIRPAGLAAWIAREIPRVDRLRRQSGERASASDEMLANISLYWFTGCIGSSFWPYYARMHGPWPIPEGPDRRRTDRLRRIPQGDPAPAPLARGQDLYRHPPLERDAERRALRGAGAARCSRARDPCLLCGPGVIHPA